ncbi:hypothetical protein A3K69_05845 [Candidatus Bathyarchaeota archaeon RBG_16_57_9]|nr:MAG: hypothetical protein A3K69_05845 [Candidatus Bathyarchaeota archaeon RBG_16_57_9]OGD53972.1 MAG: hypothetical protein A3K81_00475 [Candidatus Bathyarchaeota archaeon RBG_13_60_20]
MSSFSVELRRSSLHQVSIPRGPRGQVLLEGELGQVTGLEFVEGRVLVVKGVNGLLRLDLCEASVRRLLEPPNDDGCCPPSI